MATEVRNRNNNPPLSLDPPLEFVSPLWFANYTRQERLPGKICWHHNQICEIVERDMLLVRRQSQPPQTEEEEKEEEEEIRKKKAIEYEERAKEIKKFWKEKNEERDKEIKKFWKEKQKKEKEKEKEKKRDHKRKMCNEELKEEEQMRKDKEREEHLKALMEEAKSRRELRELLRSRLKLEKVKDWTFVENKKYDILDLLSGGTRRTEEHYLVYNNGKQVDIEHLRGKYVLLYFKSLPDDRRQIRNWSDQTFIEDLKETYHIYNPLEDFEVVFVALGNNKGVFHDSFSLMPWLAIPHENQEARDYLETKYSIPCIQSEESLLFGRDGTLLISKANFMVCYGSQFFPFTYQKILEISGECAALKDELLKNQKPSLRTLTALLGNDIISSDGEKVPTSKLDGKTVGLYFFKPTSTGFQRTSQLLEVWNSLRDEQRKAFEIVFINKDPDNLSIAKAEFKNEFGTIPWYSVAVCGRKLGWVFKKWDLAGDLIVLEPDNYEPLSYFAFKILERFGVDAYPFTMQRAVVLAKREQQNQLVLGNLLSPEAPLRRGGSACYKEETTVSKLSGKCVLLLFATDSCYESGSFLPELKRIYENKGTNDDFEIIYISMDCDESSPSSFPRSIQGMPWLVHAFAPDFAVSLAQQVFYVFPPHLPAIAAFGRDGHLETKESYLAFKIDSNPKYPFIRADMDEEIHMELVNRFEHLDISCEDELRV